MKNDLFSLGIVLLMTAGCALAQLAYVPHITRADGGFETALWLVAPNAVEKTTFELTGFTLSGTVAGSSQIDLEIGESRRVVLSEIFGSMEVAWARFAADAGVVVTVEYKARGEAKVSAHSHQVVEGSTRWRIYAGDNRLVWDGVALLNPHDEASSFIYEAYDSDGQLVGTISPFAPLMPLAKDLHVLSDSFQDAAYYEISSQLPLVLTSLRGDQGGAERLWVNPAVSLSGDDSETVDYEVVLEATWSEETHPNAYVGVNNPHFAHVAVATHRDDVTFWEPNELASPGVVQMAETGRITILETEMQAAVSQQTADQFLGLRSQISAPGKLPFTLTMNGDYPLVSLATMVAPSPDWFVGVHGLSLRNEFGWLETKTVLLMAYDAGTRENNTFQLFGPQTQPAAPIQVKMGDPLGGTMVGKLIFKRVR